MRGWQLFQRWWLWAGRAGSVSQVPAEARCARACGALSSVLGAPSAWIPTPLAVGWALAVSSSSLGLPCSHPHVLLRPGPGVGLWGGWQAAARAVPRGTPGSAHVLGALGPLESPRGMASRAGCSSCHPKELLRLTEAVAGSVLVGRAVPVPGLCLFSPAWDSGPAGRSQHKFKECCRLFCHVPEHSVCQDRGRKPTPPPGAAGG